MRVIRVRDGYQEQQQAGLPQLQRKTPTILRDAFQGLVIHGLLGPAGGQDGELNQYEDHVLQRDLVGMLPPRAGRWPAGIWTSWPLATDVNKGEEGPTEARVPGGRKVQGKRYRVAAATVKMGPSRIANDTCPMTETTTALALPAGFSALLTIAGGEADFHQIRAESLATLLSGMQRVAYLLAAVECGQEIGSRLKPSRAMREHFSLRCGIPEQGSYALPLGVGVPEELDVGPPLLDRMQRIWAALAKQDMAALRATLPDAITQRVLREFSGFLPKAEGLCFYLQTPTTPAPVVLNWRVSRFISDCLTPRASEDAVMTITGELLRIDFAARQVTILYPPTRREIVCTYLPDIEDSIIESRKEPIQVTGRFVLDDDGNPNKLMDVSRIEPVDFSPLVVTELEKLPVRMKAPLELVPVLDEESQQYLCVADASLGLDAFALTREHLFDEVQEQLCMLWQEYACAPDEELDDTARLLKAQLHQRMGEAHATA